MQKRNEDYEKLMDHALGLLSKRRLTCYGMELRLRRKKIGTESDILSVVKRLQQLEYLDDASYAADFIKDRLKFRPRGIMALKRDLYKKGLQKEVSEEAILNAHIDEKEIATGLAENKRSSLRRFPFFKQKQKLVLFLRSKGFQANVIYKIVDELKE